jgi:hypothetical protein
LIPWSHFASTETLQCAIEVDGWTALEAVLFLVYLPTLSIIQSNNRMTHDELEGMKKERSCSVNVVTWHFSTGTVYIQENVSRDSQSPG